MSAIFKIFEYFSIFIGVKIISNDLNAARPAFRCFKDLNRTDPSQVCIWKILEMFSLNLDEIFK